jgi:hypothetical protein
MNAIPLGGDLKDVDPETRNALREQMQRCRDSAHWEISGMIGGAKITVWKERSDGGLEPAGAKWAQQTFDAKGTGSDVLYFDRVEWEALLSRIASDHSQRYLARLRAQETSNGAFDIPQACADISLITWDDFSPNEIAALEQHAKQAADDEYWTWPEALAWVGSRDFRKIATLRHYGRKWLDAAPAEPDVALGAQYYVARQYCASPGEDEATLHRAVERGDVATIGRQGLSGPAGPLSKETWRGGKIVYSRGVAMLVSKADHTASWATDIAVRRQDLITVFRSSEEIAPPEWTKWSELLGYWKHAANQEFVRLRDLANSKASLSGAFAGSAHIRMLMECALEPIIEMLDKARKMNAPESIYDSLRREAASCLDQFQLRVAAAVFNPSGRYQVDDRTRTYFDTLASDGKRRIDNIIGEWAAENACMQSVTKDNEHISVSTNVTNGTEDGRVSCTTVESAKSKRGPARDKTVVRAITSVKEDCLVAGYTKPLNHGELENIKTMLSNKIEEFSNGALTRDDRSLRKYAGEIKDQLPDG